MINILIPLSGKNTFKVNELNSFPRILNEINGRLLIERAADPFTNLGLDKVITVALPEQETKKYQLNKVVSLLGSGIQTCAINGNTQGAACSALLAIESLDLDSPLIISSFEQVFDFDITPHIISLIEEEVDAGVLTFEAIHPKWSFVKTDPFGYVTEAAEKIPISKQAIAGLYYYKTAGLFIDAAQSMIRKGVKTNESYFISPTLNEIILREGTVKAIEIDKTKYFHINDDHELDTFEIKISEDKENIKKHLLDRTRDYIRAFHNKQLTIIADYFSNDFTLIDPTSSFKGKGEVLAYIGSIFEAESDLCFYEKNIFVTDKLQSIIEFELIRGDKVVVGTDVIQWNKDYFMVKMDAYLYEKNDV